MADVTVEQTFTAKANDAVEWAAMLAWKNVVQPMIGGSWTVKAPTKTLTISTSHLEKMTDWTW